MRGFRAWQNALIAAAVGAAFTIGWFTVRDHATTIPEHAITARPIQVDSDGYASSQTCRSCHPSQYETWRASFHRTMTQVATPQAVRADFDGVSVADVQGRPMRLERRGVEFWAEFDNPDWTRQTPTPDRITRQVMMITGSHHQQVYWYGTGINRLLGQLPGTYLVAERRWIPRRSAFLRPPVDWPEPETGRWNAVCIDCHATHGKAGFDAAVGSRPMLAQTANTTVGEFGIACESCHGPSARHADLNQNPLRRYWVHLTGRGDSTTVQPALLDAKHASQVCGQCHGVWGFRSTADKAQANAAGLPYRPGDELMTSRVVVQPTAPSRDAVSSTPTQVPAEYSALLQGSFWSDGMIRVSGREYNGLIDSPCFKNATDNNRTLSCFSCHTMHKSADDSRSTSEWADGHQVSPGKESNEACLACHQAFKGSITAHTRHRADSTGSSCYNCHMPYTTYGLLKALRSHQISSPTVAESVATGRPNACNVCHADKTLAWTSENLERWYGIAPPPLGEDEQRIAASVLWLLRGDAGQRALAAWSLGWQPAQQASGTAWIAPYLSLLLNDPYDAVRFISYRSLRSIPGFSQFEYNFVAPSPQLPAAGVRAMDLWRRGSTGERRGDTALLFDDEGIPRRTEWIRLVRLRDDRPVSLIE